MSEEKYLVSFGNSRTYVANSRSLIEEITRQLRSEMEQRFPTMAPSAIPEPQITPSSDPEVYNAYPQLTSKDIVPILSTLVTGEEVEADTRDLNSDAPWSNV